MRTLPQNQNQNTPRNLKRVKGGVTSDAQSTTPPSAQYNAPAPPQPPAQPTTPVAPNMNPPTTPSIQGAGTPQPTTTPETTGAPSGQYTTPQQTGMGLPTAPENPMGDMAMAARPMAARPVPPSQPLERRIATPIDEDTQMVLDARAQQEAMQEAEAFKGPTGPRIEDYITPETYTPENFADTLAEGETVPTMDMDSPMGTDRNRQILQAYQPMVESGGFADYDEYAEAANALGDTEVTQGQFTGYKTDKAFKESPYYSVVENIQESSNRDIDLLRNRLIGQARIDAQRAGYAPGSREYNNMVRNATDMASQESVRIRQAAGQQYMNQLDKYLDREEANDRRLEERDYQETQKRDATYLSLLDNQPAAIAAYNQAKGAGMSPEKAYQSLLDTEGNMKPKYVKTPMQQDIATRTQELMDMYPGLSREEANEKAREDVIDNQKIEDSRKEELLADVRVKEEREKNLSDLIHAKENDGTASQEYVDALSKLTPTQIAVLKQDPRTANELEEAGLQLNVNFDEMGLHPGDQVDTIAKKAGVTPLYSRDTRDGKTTVNMAPDGKVSYIEKDGEIFLIREIARTKDTDSVDLGFFEVGSGEDDITNKIVGYNIRTGQEEILWDDSKGQ